MQAGCDESRGPGIDLRHPTNLIATAAVQASYQQYLASHAVKASPMAAPLFSVNRPAQPGSTLTPTMLATQTAPKMSGDSSRPILPNTRESEGKRKRRLSQSDGAATAPVVSEDERKRVDRNLKEQQRSIQISHLLSTLRDILVEAKVHPDSDKLSRHTTLSSVVDYIKQLQHANAHFDTENQKLRQSLGKTNEVLSGMTVGQVGSTQGADVPAKVKPGNTHSLDVSKEEDVDYRCVFQQCGIALAAVKIDGRFIDCNSKFEALTGYDRDELIAPIQSPNDDSEEDNKLTNTTSSESSSRGSSVDSSLTGVTTLTLFSLLDPLSMEELYGEMKEVIEEAMGKFDDGKEDSTPAKSSISGTHQQNFWCGKIISRHEPGEV